MNTEIRHKGDSGLQQMKDIIAHIAGQSTPFVLQQILKLGEIPIPKAQQAKLRNLQLAGMVGITPAPKEIDKTPAEKMLATVYDERPQSKANTKEEADRNKLKGQLRSSYYFDEKATEPMIQQAVEKGLITRDMAYDIRHQSSWSLIKRQTQNLEIDELIKVYEVASDKERAEMEDNIRVIIRNLRRKEDKFKEYEPELKRLKLIGG